MKGDDAKQFQHHQGIFVMAEKGANLSGYFHVLRQRWWITLAAFLTALAIGLAAVILLPKTYTGKATLRITTAVSGGSDFVNRDINYTDRLVNTLAKIAESDETAAMLARQFGMTRPPTVRAEILANTELMELSVTGPTPEIARDMANFEAAAIVAESQRQSGNDSASALKELAERTRTAEADVKDAQNAYVEVLGKKDADPREAVLAQNRLEVVTNFYQSLLEQSNRIAVGESLRISLVSVIAPAETPIRATFPNIPIVLGLAALLGLISGVGITFLVHRLDDRLYAENRVRELTGLPVLGSVPQLKFGRTDNQTSRLRLQQDAIHLVKTNVLAAHGRMPFKSLLVTSANQAEGKTTVSLGLAISLARAGYRVVLIDADLRKPSVHNRMELTNEFGLGNLLSGLTPASPDADQKLLQRAIRPSFVPSLDIITAGAVMSNPAELLSSARMRALLDRLEGAYDFVMFDSAPFLIVPDSVGLAHMVERLIMVASKAQSTEAELKQVIEQAGNSGLNFMGVVFNRTEWREEYFTYSKRRDVEDMASETSAAKS
jgi:capsular exopolysaccharide synthesis family protein